MSESSTDLEERLCRSRPVSPFSLKGKGQKTDHSHKLTEKRRRDRMNISMSEIAQLLPSSSASKQLEKAEILEKTISYIKKLQELTGDLKQGNETENLKFNEKQNATTKDDQPSSVQPELNSNYYSGFSDCIKEVFHCLTNVEAMDLEQPCFQRLMGHLQNELDVLRDHGDGSGSEKSHKDNSKNKSLPPLMSSHDCWRHKRSHDKMENSSIQNGNSHESPATKRPHVDCSDSNGSSTSSETVSSSSKTEKRKASLGTGCTPWNENRTVHSSKVGSTVGSEKEKEISSNSLKQESNNMFDKSNMDGGGCGTDSAGVNNWPNLSLDMPIQATPLLPRTPYIPSPYTVPTYALHPMGTHFIPVVLHLSFPLPPFPEMNGRLNAVPNGYFGSLNYLRMQFPCIPSGFPFAPQVNGIAGMNGVQIPKNESGHKQCDSKSRDAESANIRHDHSAVNESAARELLNNID